MVTEMIYRSMKYDELKAENKRLRNDLEKEKVVSRDFQEMIHELFQVNKRLRETIFYFRGQFRRITNKGHLDCRHDIDLCNEVLSLTDKEIEGLDQGGGCPVSGGGE